MEHPSGLVKKKLHVIYLKSLGLPHYEIERISGDRVTAYLKEFDESGLARIGVLRTYCPVSALLPYQDRIKAHFQQHTPHTISEAAHEIEKLVGIKLALGACRDFMRKRLGMKFRKMAVILSKADPEKQEIFLNDNLEPLLAEEKQGKRKVFFVDAAHFVMGAFLAHI